MVKQVREKQYWRIHWQGIMHFRGRIDFRGSEDKEQEEVVLWWLNSNTGFLDLQNQSNFYYQQRYNAIDAEATMTVSEDWLFLMRSRIALFLQIRIDGNFSSGSLLNEPLIQLSNGENKRLQILKAVLQIPCFADIG